MTPLYAPRPLRHLMMWRIGSIRVKPYHIGHAVPTEPRVSAARLEAERMAEAAATEGGSHDLGFAVMHEGDMGTWLLMDWWAHGDILCQRLSLNDGAGFRAVDDRPLAACVWELPVLAHERNAWVRHMMHAPVSADRYLSDRLPEGAV
ncbi:hypothetical protein [Palleronia sp.]|uniref:hypothetical protein n=1 Tax=Palleronia sp. TaxID=1940284 RepID=UPI0035C87085